MYYSGLENRISDNTPPQLSHKYENSVWVVTAWVSRGSSRARIGGASERRKTARVVAQPPIDSVSSLSFRPKANHLVATTCDNQERERDHFSQFITEGFTSYCKRNRKDKVVHVLFPVKAWHLLTPSAIISRLVHLKVGIGSAAKTGRTTYEIFKGN